MNEGVGKRETPVAVFILVRCLIAVTAGVMWLLVARSLAAPDLVRYIGLALVVLVISRFNFGMRPPRSGWR